MSSPINSSPTYLMSGQTALGHIGSNLPLTNPISSNKFLSKQEREALIQYTKHFIRKAVQIIVQSRLGDKKPTKSRVYAYNSDWFNLSIKDIAQITSMTKNSLGNVESLFNVNSPFCIEISLRTPENQTMILETWCILFNDQLADPSQKVCYSVYKKMSIVLRSLMCNTRCTPTYQLSRRQSSDTYVLLYRMYCGEPIVHHLGENYATAKVGTVGTPIGSIIVNLAYRTRLTMTPQNSAAHCNEPSSASLGGIQIKDDHFTSNRDEPRTYADSPQNDLNLNQNSSSSSSSLFKRSASNLNTIAETMTEQNCRESQVSRAHSKTLPIPMRQPEVQTDEPAKAKSSQLASKKRDSTEQNEAESSTDEYNSSSIASTPDRMYYFKLKSAAFVPSASFNNNYYSASMGNLNNEQDVPPPFMQLLSNEYSNNVNSSTSLVRNAQQQQQQQQVTQSPPPPQLSLEYQNTFHMRQRINEIAACDDMASPCSLPNFKMLDNQLQHQFLNKIEAKSHNNSNSDNNNVSSLIAAIPDDFVFIESKKIAFGLSSAANDLSTFFKACENPPILESFLNEPSLSETLKDLDQQLLMYESKISEFDELIKSLETN